MMDRRSFLGILAGGLLTSRETAGSEGGPSGEAGHD